MPCMYFTHWLFGRLGSGLRRYKYSAICFRTPIKTRSKDTNLKGERFRAGIREAG